MVPNEKTSDIDPYETEDWVDSLESVIERDGVDRAHYLIQTLIDEARASGVFLPYSARTSYINSIPYTNEVQTPGDPALE